MSPITGKYKAFIAFMILCIIWSSTWMVIKIGLYSLPPFIAAGMRFFVAFVILFLYALLTKIVFPRGFITHIFFLWFGLLNFTGGYALVYWAEQYISSGLASILFSVMPFFVLMLSVWLLPQESIDLRKIIGVLIGFTGVVVIFGDQISFQSAHENVIIGMIGVLSAPLFAAFGTIAGKRKRKHMNPIVLITFPILYASISFLVLHFIFESNEPVRLDFYAIFSILYLAIAGTAIAFALYFWMLKNTSAVLMSSITFITPPLALVWGWMLLGEPVTIFLVFGMILILAGIFMIRYEQSNQTYNNQ